MDKLDWLDWFVTVALFVVATLIGALICAPKVRTAWESAAIERGYGLYCPHNGEFAWVGECEEK